MPGGFAAKDAHPCQQDAPSGPNLAAHSPPLPGLTCPRRPAPLPALLQLRLGDPGH